LKTQQYRRIMGIVLFCLGITMLLIFIYFPIIWMVTTSFKQRAEAFKLPPDWIFTPTLENYVWVLTRSTLPRCYVNSMIAGFGSVLLASLIGIPAAYALARFEMKRKEDIAFFILTARMGPAIGFMIPFFLMWKTLGMLDNIFALILTYLTFNIPITLWMMRGFFQAIPRDIEEAAMVDGCTRFQVFFKIVLPLVRTGMLATFTLCLIFSWIEFPFALVLTYTSSVTLPVSVTQFITHQGIQWGQMTAAAVLISLPVIIFAIAAHKYIVRGLTFGIIKG